MSPKANGCVLAIDWGSGSVRAAAVDLRGRQVGFEQAPLVPDTPPELAPFGKEFRPEKVWRLVVKVVRGALKGARVKGSQVLAVSATSQREGIALLDRDGHELYLGPNIDVRALLEGQVIDQEHGGEVYRTTGHTPSLLFAPARLRWFAQHRPGLFHQVRWVLPLDGWITFRLTGEAAAERASAGEAGLLDIRRRAWARDLLGRLDVPAQALPPLVDAGAIVGGMTRKAAGEFRLPVGTPVVAGGPDTQCGLLGMGVIAPGQIGIVAGTTAPVQMALSQPAMDAAARTWTGLHVLPERWVLESTVTDAGGAYRWLGEILGEGAADPFESLEKLAAKAPPGVNGVVGHLGPRLGDMSDLSPRWGGFLFPVPFFVGPVERGHLVRGALENLAFAVKANIAQLEAISGCAPPGVALGGGMARSRVLAGMLADVLGTEVSRFRTHEVTAAGAAMCAAAGAGVYLTAWGRPAPRWLGGQHRRGPISFERWSTKSTTSGGRRWAMV